MVKSALSRIEQKTACDLQQNEEVLHMSQLKNNYPETAFAESLHFKFSNGIGLDYMH